jgi:hypothetical protein
VRVSSASGLLGRQVDDRHVGPLAGVEHGDGAADAAVAAGDQGDLVRSLSAPL